MNNHYRIFKPDNTTFLFYGTEEEAKKEGEVLLLDKDINEILRAETIKVI